MTKGKKESFLDNSMKAIAAVIRALDNSCANKTADYENQHIDKRLKTSIDYGDISKGLVTIGTIFNPNIKDKKQVGTNKSNKVNYLDPADIIKIVPNTKNGTIEISDSESGLFYDGIKPDQIDFMIELVKFMIGDKNAISGTNPYKKGVSIKDLLNNRNKNIKK